MPPELSRFPLAHLAIAVESLEEARALYRSLGFRLEAAERIPREKVRAQMATRGDLCIELLEAHPAGEGPIAKFLAARGAGLHHVALRTASLEADLKRLAAAGIRARPGYPAPGRGASRVAFLDPKTTGGVLFELVEGAPGHLACKKGGPGYLLPGRRGRKKPQR